MLTAGGRAPPFGDLANCATAAGADAGTSVQLADFFAEGWRAKDHPRAETALPSDGVRLSAAFVQVIFRRLSVPGREGAKGRNILADHVTVGFDERVEATIRRCPKSLRRRCQRRAVDARDQHISRHRSKYLLGLSRGGAEKDAIWADWQLDDEARLIEPAFPMKG